MSEKFSYRIVWSDEDAEYVGRCDQFPSLSWLAPSPESALRGIRKVVAGVTAEMSDEHFQELSASVKQGAAIMNGTMEPSRIFETHAMAATASLQHESVKQGTDRLTMEEIDAEIRAVRRSRKSKE